MSHIDPIRRLADSDPLAGRSAELEVLTDGRERLLDGIIASTVPDLAPEPAPRRQSVMTSRFFRAGLAVAALCAVAFAVFLTQTGSEPDQGAAWAAPLVEFAEASPLVLIDDPGWRVWTVDEQGLNHGDMYFVNTPEHGPRHRPRIVVELRWNKGSPAKRIRDLDFAMPEVASDVPVLDTKADVFELGQTRTRRVLMAAWEFEGRTLVIRSTVPSLEDFKRILGGFEKVDVNTWLGAMPDSVINRFDRDDKVEEMLRGIPLPDDFDPAAIPGRELTKDEYQLGAAVAGSVSCRWIDQWSKARRNGDRASEIEATRAMATSTTWPLLREMGKQGAYPEVVWGYADAMKGNGKFYGRPLEYDVSNGLGCWNLGVNLDVPEPWASRMIGR